MVQNGNTEASQALANFWPKVGEDVKTLTNNDFKQQELPLARIKKIMKLDDDVKMISAEAPVLFSKAAELFITELTLRAWIHTEDNKRRTLQRNDIAMAISKYDQFDFLIDIVPRDDLKPQKAREETTSRPASNIPDQVQYYLQLAQQNNQALQQTSQQAQAAAIPGSSLAGQQIQIVQGGGQILSVMPPSQMVQAAAQQQVSTVPPAATTPNPNQQQQQSSQHQQQQQQQQQQQMVMQSINVQQQQQQQQQLGGIQIVQQVVGPNGEIQQIPLQLSAQQLQMIRMQLGAAGAGQQIVLQTAPQQGQSE